MHRLLILLACLSVAMRADAGNQTVPGARAVLLPDGTAAAPANAPATVKTAIWAVNTIVRKPYRWGGGHATFYDVGYDCSGTVSFLLHNAGVLDAPTPSKGLLGWAESGPGRWITVYARSGHTFAIVCGLRLDTSGHVEHEGPRWRSESRDLGKFAARHPGGL